MIACRFESRARFHTRVIDDKFVTHGRESAGCSREIVYAGRMGGLDRIVRDLPRHFGFLFARHGVR